jgi:hypothetical protein
VPAQVRHFSSLSIAARWLTILNFKQNMESELKWQTN